MTDSLSLIDIGANLAHDSFDEDRDDVIDAAAAAGVGRLVITGSSEASSRSAASLADQRPSQLYATAGVHPHHASDFSSAAHATINELADLPQVVAIGECGLDFFRNFSPRNSQLDAFEQQLSIAVEKQLPVFLHQRDAHDDFVNVLQPALPKLPRAVAHCFTGTDEELEQYVDMGLYIGITGWICDERRGLHLRDIIHRIPADRLMLETDAPYLLPRTLRPKPKTRRNEPKYLPEVLRIVAESLGKSIAEVAATTTANAVRFFALDPDA